VVTVKAVLPVVIVIITDVRKEPLVISNLNSVVVWVIKNIFCKLQEY
jgi:hypothetical protein